MTRLEHRAGDHDRDVFCVEDVDARRGVLHLDVERDVRLEGQVAPQARGARDEVLLDLLALVVGERREVVTDEASVN